MQIEIIIVAVVALVIGWLVARLMGQRKTAEVETVYQRTLVEKQAVEQQVQQLLQQNEETNKALQSSREEAEQTLATRLTEQRDEATARIEKVQADMQSHYNDLIKEKEERHADQVSILQKRVEQLDQLMAQQKEEANQQQQQVVEKQQKLYEARFAEQKENHEKAMQSLEQRFEETIEKIKQQMEVATGKMLKERQEEFATSSKNNIDGIVGPLKETIEKMEKAMSDNSKVQTTMSTEIKTNMEAMINQSIAAQRSAEELTRAFKHESKTQGDWGEVVLSNLLASQGFTEGADFETQAVMKDADGNIIHTDDGASMIPDVLLHLDKGRDVVIDSKVSMTAYINYANADDEITKRLYLKEHIASIRKHIDELAAKDYTKYQTNSHIDFVIMFVPHVQALWVATTKEPTLWQEAMERRVFIADEQTLYAALRIIRITWTHIDQESNHKRLFELAQQMVERTGDFLKAYDNIGRNLQQAQQAYEDGKKKLAPTGQSISTTANNIMKLGNLSNRRKKRNRKGYATEPIIPMDYIDEEGKQLLENSDFDPDNEVPQTDDMNSLDTDNSLTHTSDE